MTLLEVESASQTDGGRIRTRLSNSFPTRQPETLHHQALVKEGRWSKGMPWVHPDDQSASGDEQWRSGRAEEEIGHGGTST